MKVPFHSRKVHHKLNPAPAIVVKNKLVISCEKHNKKINKKIKKRKKIINPVQTKCTNVVSASLFKHNATYSRKFSRDFATMGLSWCE